MALASWRYPSAVDLTSLYWAWLSDFLFFRFFFTFVHLHVESSRCFFAVMMRVAPRGLD